jgi:hypothetical protein
MFMHIKENFMNKLIQIPAIRAIATITLTLAAPLAIAGGQPDVNWSISVGSPYPAPQVYAPPPTVVYVQPQPVYVRPRPVYVQPATVVQYGQPYYYVEEGRHNRMKRHHWKHQHRHGYDY